MPGGLSRWKGTLGVSGAKLAATAIGLAFSIASARLLGPEGRGEFVTITTTVALAAQILNLGLSSALLLEFSREPGSVRPLLVRCWIAAAGLAIALATLGLGIEREAPGALGVVAVWWPAIAIWVPLQLMGLYQVAAVTALGRVAALTVIEPGSRILAAVLGLAALVAFRAALPPLVVALVASEAIVAALTFAWLRSRAGIGARSRTATPALAASILRVGLRAYPVLLLPFALIRADILMMTGMRGAADAGVYSIAAQMIDLMLIVPTTAAALTLPHIVRSASPRATVGRLAREVGLVCVPLALLAGLVAPILIEVLFGEAYAGATRPFRILLPGFVLLAVETALAQILAARGYPIQLTIAWVLGLASNVAANLVLIPRWGASGAAFASTASYGLVALLVWFLVRRIPADGAMADA